MGKTTLAKLATDRPVIGTDSYRDIPWEDIPARMIVDVESLPAFAIEGVMVARALRGPKGPNGTRLPGMQVDAVVYLQRPKVDERLPGQVAMAKGVRTVFDDWHALNPQVPVFFERSRA